MALSKNSTRILITIPIDLKEKLQEKAKESNRSASNYVVNLIKQDLLSPTLK